MVPVAWAGMRTLILLCLCFGYAAAVFEVQRGDLKAIVDDQYPVMTLWHDDNVGTSYIVQVGPPAGCVA